MLKYAVIYLSLFLFSCAPTDERALDRNMIDRFATIGDDPSKPRDVDFFAIFDDEEAARGFAQWAQDNSYTLNELEAIEGMWDVSLVRKTAITPEVLFPQLDVLEVQVLQRGGFFDGWAALVLK